MHKAEGCIASWSMHTRNCVTSGLQHWKAATSPGIGMSSWPALRTAQIKPLCLSIAGRVVGCSSAWSSGYSWLCTTRVWFKFWSLIWMELSGNPVWQKYSSTRTLATVLASWLGRAYALWSDLPPQGCIGYPLRTPQMGQGNPLQLSAMGTQPLVNRALLLGAGPFLAA